jgi:hypothetical protein
VPIAHADAAARLAFDQHCMAVRDEFPYGRRHEADTVLLDLDFFRDADAHGSASSSAGAALR